MVLQGEAGLIGQGGQDQHRGTGAGDDGRVALLAQRVHDGHRGGQDPTPVLLVEAVLGSGHEQVGTPGERQHEHGGPGGVEQGVLARHGDRQDLTGLLGGQARRRRRDEQAHPEGGVHGHGRHARASPALDPGDSGASEHGGRDVVGMALEVGSQGEDPVIAEGLGLGDEAARQHESGHGGTGGRAHAPAVGDPVDTAHLEAGLWGTNGVQTGPQRLHDEVVVIGGDRLGAHTLNNDAGGAGDRPHRDLVVVAESHAEGVEARTHVRRRGRDPDGRALVDDAHVTRPRRVGWRRPRRPGRSPAGPRRRRRGGRRGQGGSRR